MVERESESRGPGLDPHTDRRHRVVSLSKTHEAELPTVLV